ncbi:hypothetical protein ACFE04_014891 [Oxalis oulophora]
MAGHNNIIEEAGEVDYEEVMLWLPSHVLDEAINIKTKEEIMNKRRQQYRHRPRLSPPPPPESFPSQLNSSNRQKNNNFKRTKQVNNSGSFGGPGMQAIFLDSEAKSCGTGVFLPRSSVGSQSSKKPACSPVLIPARVVQALNLNVHALGLQVSPSQDLKHKSTPDRNLSNTTRNKNGRDASTKCYVLSHNQSSSPSEIFLPKEWTY